MFTGLDLILTYQCPSRCRHCMYHARPGNAPSISSEAVESCLEFPDFQSISIHGGEPLLFPEEVFSMLELARNNGIDDNWLITNGFWGEGRERAKETLTVLRESGLANICFSVDAFHQEWIPFAAVLTCLEEALSFDFTTVSVDAYFLEGRDADNPWDRKTSELLTCILHPGVEVNERGLTFYGRGSGLTEGLDKERLPGGRCSPPFWLGPSLESPHTVELDPYGNVTLCPGIRIGDAYEEPLPTTLADYDYRDHPILKVIVEDGPIGLVDLAENLSIKYPEQYVDECHMCYELRRLLRPHYKEGLGPSRCYGI